MVAAQPWVRVLAVAVVDVELGVTDEACQVGQLEGEAGDLVRRGQPVVEGQNALVGTILHVSRRPGDHQEHRIAPGVCL